MGTVYNRGKVYWIKYSQNGKFLFESSKSQLKSVAKELLIKREGEIQKGQIPGIHFDRVVLDELVDDFLWDREINNRGVDEAKFRVNHLKEHFDGMLVTRITDTHIRAYIEARKGEGAANATINRELAALKRMFNLGAQKRPPKVDRAQTPHITMLKEDNIRKGFFEHGDYLALLDALFAYLRPFCQFAYWTGWRKEEIQGLTWGHVDVEQGIVKLQPGETKNGHGRTVYLEEELKGVIQDQRDSQRAEGRITEWVFPGRNGLSQIGDFRWGWRKACKEAGIGGKLFHDFRRSAVRNMVRAGVSEHTAMKISGHETRSVFDRYDIVSDADLKAAAKKQTEYLKGQTVTKTVTIGDFSKKVAQHEAT